jgi:hypothetical protein
MWLLKNGGYNEDIVIFFLNKYLKYFNKKNLREFDYLNSLARSKNRKFINKIINLYKYDLFVVPSYNGLFSAIELNCINIVNILIDNFGLLLKPIYINREFDNKNVLQLAFKQDPEIIDKLINSYCILYMNTRTIYSLQKYCHAMWHYYQIIYIVKFINIFGATMSIGGFYECNYNNLRIYYIKNGELYYQNNLISKIILIYGKY